MAGQKTALGVPNVDFSAPDDQFHQQLDSFWDTKGVDHSEDPYWMGKKQEMVQRGQQLNNPGYGMARLNDADILGGARSGEFSATPEARAKAYQPFYRTDVPAPMAADLSPMQSTVMAQLPALMQLLGTNDPNQIIQLLGSK